MYKLIVLLLPFTLFAGEAVIEPVGGLKAWLIGMGITIAVGSLMRFLPKQKLINMVSPVCYNAGKVISKILLVRLGKKSAESIEEGIFATLTNVIYAAVDNFMKGMLEDNKADKINEIKDEMRKNNPLFNIKLPK